MHPSLGALLVPALAFAQAPAPPTAPPKAAAPDLAPASAAQSFSVAFAGIEGMLVGVAEAMPEDRFDYVPTGGDFKGVRTFAQQIKHIAATNYLAGEGISGQKPAVDVAALLPTLKTKAELLRFLKDSFAFARKAVAGLKESELYAPVPSPFGGKPMSRMFMALIPVGHGADHYGQMVIYLRHNGIVPPMSRR